METRRQNTMARKQAHANHGPPKVGRAKRQTAAADNAAGPSNEAPTATRPRGRPPKGGGAASTEAHRWHGSSKVAEGSRCNAARE
ncbi:hypothetical protein MTO96_039977 [Rhipicephalus appendiculatus]